MNESKNKVRVSLTGPVQLELLAPYFRAAGYEVSDAGVPIDAFGPDYIYDVTSHDPILSEEVPSYYDARMERLSGCPYSLDGIRAIVDEFAWERLRSSRKILAVDADNTLWKGILSEDGPDALVPFVEFQQGLRRLAENGVVLVMLSKNDAASLVPAVSAEMRSPVPGLLIADAFSKFKVNWEPKAGNLLEACRELNLPPDSVVFVDDNPHERAQMAAHLPEVAIAPFPDDLSQPKQFLRRLEEYFFSGAGQTDEDRLRTHDYRANELRAAYLNKGGYLDALDLRVTPALAAQADLDRLAQMAAKTNQFNATTLRRSRAEFERLVVDPAKRVWIFRTRDRFGEQGIVCYVVLDVPSGHVTDFVMSCRAMGRTLEHFVYAFVCRESGFVPVIDFVPTAKNRPFADFYATIPAVAESHYRQA